jgi:hypothetical protein
MQSGVIGKLARGPDISNEDVDSLVFGEAHTERDIRDGALLEQYKLCVEMADRVSSRRQTANAFYLSISSTFLAGYSLLGGRGLNLIDAAVLSLVGIGFCLLWLRGIKSYSDLNSGKFKVILSMERALRCMPYFAEWEVLERGKNKSNYTPFKAVESLVPKLFVTLFAILFLREVNYEFIRELLKFKVTSG